MVEREIMNCPNVSRSSLNPWPVLPTHPMLARYMPVSILSHRFLTTLGVFLARKTLEDE